MKIRDEKRKRRRERGKLCEKVRHVGAKVYALEEASGAHRR